MMDWDTWKDVAGVMLACTVMTLLLVGGLSALAFVIFYVGGAFQ